MTNAATDTPKPLSQSTIDVLETIQANPGKTAIDIATLLSVSVGSVTGSVNTLKKRELISFEDGKLTALAGAEYAIGESAGTEVKKSTINEAKLSTETIVGDDLGDDVRGESTPAPSAGTSVFATMAEGIGAASTVSAAAAAAMAASAPAAPAGTTAPAGATTLSKSAKAKIIFDSNPGAPRKLLMSMMMAPECGLTEAGANTYIYNFRKAAGQVTPRGTAAPVAAAAPISTEAPAFVAETTGNVVVEAAVITAVTEEAAPAEAPAETPVAEAAPAVVETTDEAASA